MFIHSVVMGGLAIVTFIIPAIFAQGVSLKNTASATNGDDNGIIWSDGIPPSFGAIRRLPPGSSGFGIRYLQQSDQNISNYWFMLTGLQVMENIYDTLSAGTKPSEIVDRYVYPVWRYTPLNISAVGRGREAGLPITFDTYALILCVRWLGQISRKPKRWYTFEFLIRWPEGGAKDPFYVVAEGNFTSILPIPLGSVRSAADTAMS